MNVAIIGASGIGKQHAKWFQAEGCRIAAFSGTTEDSCQRTSKLLTETVGFRGTAYTDSRQMIDQESLDVVCVASPQEVHLEQVRYALEAGCHVYCEKPFVWPKPGTYDAFAQATSAPAGVSDSTLRDLLESAHVLVDYAADSQLVLAMNAQYVAARESYRVLYERERGPIGQIREFHFLLESKGLSGRYGSHEGIWIDMAPHALGQIIDWLPDGTLDASSIECTVASHRTVARFRYGGAEIDAEMGKSVDSGMNRRFGINGFIVDYFGKADDHGVYRAFLKHGDDTVDSEDYMQLSVRQFISAIQNSATEPFVNGHAAVKNLEASMVILEHGKQV
ncbi:MAG: Gfo/Idh/MocA family oxidoreductase [Candidatus Latescibacteria bacterium]|jgi:predicted dehydrogenase|nr:Gfo/Idh/MocA family oxidoreductase [Candidatus Latescibacterota bacterium]